MNTLPGIAGALRPSGPLPPDFDPSVNEITLRNIDYEDGAIFELLTSPVEDNILFEVV